MSGAVTLYERFERIMRAYRAALAGREPETVSIVDLLPAIFGAVPDADVDEIIDALRWSARKDDHHADRLREYGGGQPEDRVIAHAGHVDPSDSSSPYRAGWPLRMPRGSL